MLDKGNLYGSVRKKRAQNTKKSDRSSPCEVEEGLTCPSSLLS